MLVGVHTALQVTVTIVKHQRVYLIADRQLKYREKVVLEVHIHNQVDGSSRVD